MGDGKIVIEFAAIHHTNYFITQIFLSQLSNTINWCVIHCKSSQVYKKCIASLFCSAHGIKIL